MSLSIPKHWAEQDKKWYSSFENLLQTMTLIHWNIVPGLDSQAYQVFGSNSSAKLSAALSAMVRPAPNESFVSWISRYRDFLSHQGQKLGPKDEILFQTSPEGKLALLRLIQDGILQWSDSDIRKSVPQNPSSIIGGQSHMSQS